MLTSCKSKTIMKIASPSGQLQGSRKLVYKEVVEILSNYKHFYFWSFGNRACCDSTGSKQHFVSVYIFFSVYGVCLANHFLTNIFTHSKLHQHVRLTC